jgi:hypothetical protein
LSIIAEGAVLRRRSQNRPLTTRRGGGAAFACSIGRGLEANAHFPAWINGLVRAAVSATSTFSSGVDRYGFETYTLVCAACGRSFSGVIDPADDAFLAHDE